jgi:hypothetical protein
MYSNRTQSRNLTGDYKNLWEYTRTADLSELHMNKDKYIFFNSCTVHSIVYVEQTNKCTNFYKYYLFFILELLLHISATICHNQGACIAF